MLSKVIMRQPYKMVSMTSQRAFHSSAPLNEVMTVRESIRKAMTDEMRRDDKVFLMGEEVGQY